VIRILSKNKEKTLIEIPLEHWPSPVNKPEPVAKSQQSSSDSLAEQAMENRIIPAPAKIPQQPARVVLPTTKPIPELFRELTLADAADEDLKALEEEALGDQNLLRDCLEYFISVEGKYEKPILLCAVADCREGINFQFKKWKGPGPLKR
jgi:hypothetical protein